jgi:hypothetical protein
VSLDAAIKTVARQFNWTPVEIEKLKVDDIDYKGIYYWYNDCVDYINEIKSKHKNPK